MSEETFRIMRGLDMRGLETQVALQCAPLLTGIKASNLLNVGADKREEAERLFEKTFISLQVLYEHAGRISALLYRKELLEKILESGGVRGLLDELGYEGMELEEILRRVSARYQSYMEGRQEFPHEIGILLEYPVEDVRCFIEKEGREFLYAGYWKVYGNLAAALRIFEAYDLARESVIRMAGNGAGIRDILVSDQVGRCRAFS